MNEQKPVAAGDLAAMTKDQLQAEIGRLQAALVRRVCGDPIQGIGLRTQPAVPPTAGRAGNVASTLKEPSVGPWQAGMSNAELVAAWAKALPGVTPTDRDLSAFAVGAEVGFDRARNMTPQDGSRVHHAQTTGVTMDQATAEGHGAVADQVERSASHERTEAGRRWRSS